MKKRKGWTLCCVLLALVFLGTGPCEKPKLDESIEPLQKYQNNLVQDGESGVPINLPVAFYLGQNMDPTSINIGTVKLRPAGGANLTIDVSFFDPITNPRGIAVTPLAGGPCDLDPNQDYELVLDGVKLADGTTLPLTVITFTTGSVPAGYTPHYCSAIAWTPFLVTDNSLDPLAGISGDLTTETTHHLDIVALGVETVAPYYGYKFLVNRYLMLIEIINMGSVNFNLAPMTKWLNLRTLDGVDHQVALPADTIPPGETLALYVSDDGSSYYAISEADHTADISTGNCDPPGGGGCPVFTPDVAFTHLAAAADASPSAIPFITEGDTLDMAAGINGGLIDELTIASGWTIVVRAMAVQARDSYGYDQLYFGYDDLGFGYYDSTFEMFLPQEYPTILRDKPVYVMGRYEFLRYGAVFRPYENFINTPNSYLLIYIYNKDTTAYTLTGGRTITIKDNGVEVVAPLPDITIPPGHLLPLYVAISDSSVATFYAYTGPGPVHTLDPHANLCDGTDTCPVLDPGTAFLAGPAATLP